MSNRTLETSHYPACSRCGANDGKPSNCMEYVCPYLHELQENLRRNREDLKRSETGGGR